jgi:quinol monooxygenase YgiN
MSYSNAVVVRIAELDIDPNQIDEYKTLLAVEIEASVALEPGVLFLHAVSIKDAPYKVRLLECYASQAAYDAHLRSPYFLTYKSLTAGMVLALTLTEVDPVMLATKPIG